MKGHHEARIAVFASGSGTNAEAIITYFQNSDSGKVVLLLSNNPSALALQRARVLGVPGHIFTREQFRDSDEVIQRLRHEKVTHIVLAGFLWLIPQSLIAAFPDRIVNIHPSLLPKFSGKGMYGAKVHEAVRLAGETVTGITIHAVNEHYDEGKILFQATTELGPHDSAETIARKVHELEYEHFPREIEKWIRG